MKMSVLSSIAAVALAATVASAEVTGTITLINTNHRSVSGQSYVVNSNYGENIVLDANQTIVRSFVLPGPGTYRWGAWGVFPRDVNGLGCGDDFVVTSTTATISATAVWGQTKGDASCTSSYTIEQ